MERVQQLIQSALGRRILRIYNGGEAQDEPEDLSSPAEAQSLPVAL
jgi:hypothetical protein